MANSDSKNKIEIEVAIRDMFSTTLKTMGRELDVLNKRAAETGATGGGSFDKFRRSSDQLNESNKRTNASFSLMSGITTTLTRGLLGTAGLAAGFYQVAKSLDDVAIGAVRLKNFSTDTGLAISKVQDLQQTLNRGGFSKSEGDSIIGAMGSMANNLAAFKESSQVYTELSKAKGGNELATNLLNIAKTGDNAKVVTEYLKSFNQQSRETKFFMAQIAGVTISALQEMADAIDKHHNVKLIPVDPEEAKKFLELWEDTKDRLENIFNSVKTQGMKAFRELSEALQREGVTTKGITDELNAGVNIVLEKIKQDIKDVQAIIVLYKELKESTPESRTKHFEDYVGVGVGKDRPQSKGEEFDIDKTAEKIPGFKSLHEFLKGKTDEYNKGKKIDDHSGITDFGGRARTNDDGVNILTDIRDTLQRIELGSGSSGNGGGGEGNNFGTGARGGALQGSIGGFRGGAGARGSGEGGEGRGTGARGGGLQASGGGFRPYKGGGEGGEGGVVSNDAPAGGGAGINRDKWLKELNANPQLKEELFKHAIGENTDPAANQAVMETAANRADLRAITRGDKGFAAHGNLSYFQGYRSPNVNERKMMEENFDKVFRQGSDISKGATDNSSQGLAYTNEHGGASGRYGWAGKKPGRFNTTANFGGDRQTGHRGVESFETPGWGESGRGEREAYPGFRQNQLAEAERRRSSVDQAQSAGGGDKWGKINASVEFLNVPPGVRTKADADGDVFKDLNISTTKQGGIYRQDSQAYD